MARQNLGFIDQHIEKVVLGLCAVVALGVAVFAFGGFRYSINGLGPNALGEEARNQAARLADAVRNARPQIKAPTAQAKGGEDSVAELNRWFVDPAGGLIAIAEINSQSPRTQRFPPSLAALTDSESDNKLNLARIVVPGPLIVTKGRTTFDIPPKVELQELIGRSGGRPAGVTSLRNWVSLGAQVNLVEQEVNFNAARYPADAHLVLAAVRLQRKDLTESGRDWEEVDTYLPFKPVLRPQIGDSTARDEFRRLLKAGRHFVARTRLPERKSGDRVELPWVPYLDEPPKRPDPTEKPQDRTRRMDQLARKWLDNARKAQSGKTPARTKDVELAFMLARAAKGAGLPPESDTAKRVDEFLAVLAKDKDLGKDRQRELTSYAPPPERMMPIMANDIDVEPGHVYQYRMCQEVLNHFAGVPGALANPADAERLTLYSDWSLPSAAVEAEGDLYFFLSKADAKARQVTVTVFRKTSTVWIRKDFTIAVGDEIGRNDRRVKRTDFSTNSLCIDIDFKRTVGNAKTTSMVYLDLDSGAVRERLLVEDLRSELRKRLQREAK